MARPRGSRNASTVEVRAMLHRLARRGELAPPRWFKRLEEIGLSDDAPDRIPALRTLIAYLFGQPAARLDVEHSIGKSAEELLREIAASEQHAAAVRRAEEMRKQLAITTSVVKEGEPS